MQSQSSFSAPFSVAPNIVSSVDADPLPGYVIANGIESNGRLLGLVYVGAPLAGDGNSIFVYDGLLERSVNATLVQEGLAYVEPYDTMPITLIQRLRSIIANARSAAVGI